MLRETSSVVAEQHAEQKKTLVLCIRSNADYKDETTIVVVMPGFTLI